MKIGSIMINHSAGKDNPLRYFIYTGIDGEFATGIYMTSKMQLGKVHYMKKDIKDTDKFEVVGYSKAFDIMKVDLVNIINKGSED